MHRLPLSLSLHLSLHLAAALLLAPLPALAAPEPDEADALGAPALQLGVAFDTAFVHDDSYDAVADNAALHSAVFTAGYALLDFLDLEAFYQVGGSDAVLFAGTWESDLTMHGVGGGLRYRRALPWEPVRWLHADAKLGGGAWYLDLRLDEVDSGEGLAQSTWTGGAYALGGLEAVLDRSVSGGVPDGLALTLGATAGYTWRDEAAFNDMRPQGPREQVDDEVSAPRSNVRAGRLATSGATMRFSAGLRYAW